jgi:hypothetical protein
MADELLSAKINFETAKISWRELQRFFASGNAIAVAPTLDLTQVASALAEDDAPQVKTWMAAGLIDTVKDQQALSWYENDQAVWAVVIKPWVLVQPVNT